MGETTTIKDLSFPMKLGGNKIIYIFFKSAPFVCYPYNSDTKETFYLLMIDIMLRTMNKIKGYFTTI